MPLPNDAFISMMLSSPRCATQCCYLERYGILREESPACRCDLKGGDVLHSVGRRPWRQSMSEARLRFPALQMLPSTLDWIMSVAHAR